MNSLFIESFVLKPDGLLLSFLIKKVNKEIKAVEKLAKNLPLMLKSLKLALTHILALAQTLMIS